MCKTPAPVGGNSFRRKAENGFHGDHPGSGFQGNTLQEVAAASYLCQLNISNSSILLPKPKLNARLPSWDSDRIHGPEGNLVRFAVR